MGTSQGGYDVACLLLREWRVIWKEDAKVKENVPKRSRTDRKIEKSNKQG